MTQKLNIQGNISKTQKSPKPENYTAAAMVGLSSRLVSITDGLDTIEYRGLTIFGDLFLLFFWLNIKKFIFCLQQTHLNMEKYTFFIT
jgi:hypothetical protein